MSKAQSKRSFFRNGTDKQKVPDVVVDLRRPSAEQISKWTLSQRILLLGFMADCRGQFDAFEKELKEAANDQPQS